MLIRDYLLIFYVAFLHQFIPRFSKSTSLDITLWLFRRKLRILTLFVMLWRRNLDLITHHFEDGLPFSRAKTPAFIVLLVQSRGLIKRGILPPSGVNFEPLSLRESYRGQTIPQSVLRFFITDKPFEGWGKLYNLFIGKLSTVELKFCLSFQLDLGLVINWEVFLFLKNRWNFCKWSRSKETLDPKEFKPLFWDSSIF